MIKIALFLLGLGIIAIGVQAVVTRRIRFGVTFGDHNPSNNHFGFVYGIPAIIVGIAVVCVGASLIFRFVL
jgi:hypothetical protein